MTTWYPYSDSESCTASDPPERSLSGCCSMMAVHILIAKAAPENDRLQVEQVMFCRKPENAVHKKVR